MPRIGPGMFGIAFQKDYPLHEMAKKVGVTGVFRDVFRDPKLEGVNFGHAWYNFVLEDMARANPASHKGVHIALADEYLRKNIAESLLIPEGALDKLVDAIKNGGEFAFARPSASKRTMLHEIMHTFTNKYAKDAVRLPKWDRYGDLNVPLEAVRDLEIEAHLEFGSYPPDWIHRPQEFLTESMTQYFLGHVRPGTKVRQMCEQIIEESGDPQIKALIGTTVGMAMMIKNMGDKNGRRTRQSIQ